MGNVRGSQIKTSQSNLFAKDYKYATFSALIFILLSCGGRDITDGGINGGITTQFNLSVTSDGLKVTLDWDKIVDDDLDLYNIYRAENEGEFNLYDTAATASNSFSDIEVIADLVYEYRITALFDGNRESDPSKIVRIIPGLSTIWVLDIQSDLLSELTHDAAHFTGRFFDNLTLPVALDIDERNGYIYYIDGLNKTLNLLVEGADPAVLINDEGVVRIFSDPTDVDFDMSRNELWLADGNTGGLFHFTMISQTEWELTDSLNTGGDAVNAQLDITRGDYWVVNSVQKSIEIFQRRENQIVQVSATGFASGSLTLILDADRARAYVIDRSTGDIYLINALGESNLIANVNNAFLGAVVPSTGDVWLIADDDENGIADLVKLSVAGSRILELMNLYSDPTWIGVNPTNMNVTVLNSASGEVKIEVLSNDTGKSLSTFKSLNFPLIARIVDSRNGI